MILYFSGTGNSRFVANRMASELGDEVFEILKTDFSKPFPGGEIGFVFPTYSWGIAPVLLKIIEEEMPESWFSSAEKIWCVLTCGDETGMAHEMLRKSIERRGVTVESVWSVIMPNNYVLLPGFDVDSKDVERNKLREAPARISQIVAGIKDGVLTTDVVVGSHARLKTRLVYPLFKKWGIFPKKWRSTECCIGCGRCAKACPLKNVSMNGDRPRWGGNCCSCLACYHVCPRHAVAYGKATSRKGQYFLKVTPP